MPYIIIDLDNGEHYWLGDTPILALEAMCREEYQSSSMTLSQMEEVQQWFKSEAIKMYQLGPALAPIFPEKIPEIEFMFLASGTKVL